MTMTADARLPVRALVGTIVFVAVLPATVIVLAPYWITGWRLAPPFLGLELTRWLGVAMVVAALPLFLSFLGRFVFEGRGTPAPIAPTEKLVVGGPFRWVRNPGYVAVVAMLVGQALFFASPGALLYAAAVGLAFHVFVLVYEEPTLRDTYGAEYDAYCKAVPRWVPRRPSSLTRGK
jgi:protein-S-isoprenylcysteine O-methyltransferase Ste14